MELEKNNPYREVVYELSRDGEISEYFKYCEQERVPACFWGIEQFQELVELGYILPNMTKIRIMYSLNRGDECYLIVKDFQLEGLEMKAHSGQKGIHKPEDIFSDDCPYYEVHDRNREPENKELIDKMNE